MDDKNFMIQQAVHGYHDGHRLLAASLSLSAEAEQATVVLSDLSGHTIVGGFDEYITGYPLAEMGMYALAKTWYATEMPRPGSVFTHTLFIPFSLLAKLPDLYGLTNLFVRPLIDELLRFEHAVPLGDPSGYETQNSNETMSGLQEVLFNLYDSPDQSVLVPVSSPSVVKRTFFDVWSQQWPRLRRSFAFCTGAISGRRFESRWFDLQAVPKGRIGDVQRAIDNSVVAHFDPNSENVQSNDWCRAAILDITTQSEELRSFLFEYGAEVEGGRRDFVSMVNLFLAYVQNSESSMDSILRSLSKVFPGPTKGTKFKSNLMAGISSSNVPQAPDVRLRMIVKADESLFDTSKVQFETLVRDAWIANPNSVIATLDEGLKSKNSATEPIVAMLADSLQPDQISMSEQFGDAVMALALHRPILAVNQSFRHLPRRNDLLIEYITGDHLDEGDDLTVLWEWLLEEDYSSIEEAVRRRPSELLPLVLTLVSNAIFQNQYQVSRKNLLRIVALGEPFAAKWLNSVVADLESIQYDLRVIAIVVCALDFGSIRVLQENSAGWAYLLLSSESFDSEIRKAVNLKLFVCSMKARSRSGAFIATTAFPHIYRLLSLDQISTEEWRLLQDTIDRRRWWIDWDHCKFLVEGLIDRFNEFSWPVEYFSTMVLRDPELASNIRNTRFYLSKYDRFVEQVCAESS